MYDNIEVITVASTKQKYQGPSIGDDLLLFPEFGDLPMEYDVARRMGCILVGLCLRGEARYTVDTEERVVKPNDVIIISEGQVVNHSLARALPVESPSISGALPAGKVRK